MAGPQLTTTRRGWLSLLAAGGCSLAGTPARAELRELMKAVRDSVLPVGIYNPLNSPRFTFRGSGFVVGDGTLVITNAHVLPDAASVPVPQLAVSLARGEGTRETRLASVLRIDRAHDLALLRLQGSPLVPLALAAAGSSVVEGTSVALVGFPIGGVFGFSPVIHRGIVASVTAVALPSATSQQLSERSVARLREGPFPVYQLDATAHPGNSGGPLLDVRSGQVVGIVNMVLVRNTRESSLAQSTGISYAIPSQYALELLRQP